MVPLEDTLKRQLARELSAIMKGWSQIQAASLLGVCQQDVSRLWTGNVANFSIGRLLRLIATRHYHIEVHLKPVLRPFGTPREKPTVSVFRYDRFGARTS